MVPSCQNPAADVHEICSGQYRMKCRRESAGLLWLCLECHTKLQGMQYLEKALAIKLVSDPRYFSLEKVREIMQPAARCAEIVDWEDVSLYLKFTGVI